MYRHRLDPCQLCFQFLYNTRQEPLSGIASRGGGGGRVRLLAAQLPQSGFEDFQAGVVPGLVGEAVPISYGLWVVTVLIS